MPYISKRQLEELRDTLIEVYTVSSMERASFYGITAGSDEKTAEIKKATELWRESWIRYPLLDAIDTLKAISKKA